MYDITINAKPNTKMSEILLKKNTTFSEPTFTNWEYLEWENVLNIPWVTELINTKNKNARLLINGIVVFDILELSETGVFISYKPRLLSSYFT
jgi:hypothetical protein